jgi:hypothetical protein
MTIFLVNRHTTATKEVQIDVRDFIIKDEAIQLYTLSKLPATETFVSHKQNALKVKQIDKPVYNISVQLEPLSVNAIVLRAAPTGVQEIKPVQSEFKVFPNPANNWIIIEFNLGEISKVNIELININGQKLATLYNGKSNAGLNSIQANISDYPSGIYSISIQSEHFVQTKKIALSTF